MSPPLWPLAVVVVVVVAGFAVWRSRRHGVGVGPSHERPIEANADVLASRLEHIADNLEASAALLRATINETRAE